jgi:hypothetical protein
MSQPRGSIPGWANLNRNNKRLEHGGGWLGLSETERHGVEAKRKSIEKLLARRSEN